MRAFLRITCFILALSLALMPVTKGNETDAKTALLIIDVQMFYFPGGALPLENPGAAAQQAQKLLKKFRSLGHTVIHVRHNAKKGAEIHSLVAPKAGEKVISKNHANSFRDTELLEYLRSKHIKNLVICGMQTHMCVEAAVRAAADLGFKCTLIHDACATRALVFGDRKVSAPDVHSSTLSSLERTYARILDVERFLKEFK